MQLDMGAMAGGQEARGFCNSGLLGWCAEKGRSLGRRQGSNCLHPPRQARTRD